MKGGEVILDECRANLGYAEGDVELIKREHFEVIESVVGKPILFRIRGSGMFCFTENQHR
jgi:hypothetical protein